ncbi:MAG: hypothetical protein IJL87_03085 [Clostridia bacterium]|nr:hypothetical protein [Clostridia bacterium]
MSNNLPSTAEDRADIKKDFPGWTEKMKKREKALTTTIVIISVLAVIFTLIGGAFNRFWQNDHILSYDLKKITISRSADNETLFDITYDISVKNLKYDIFHHTYKLVADQAGFKGESDYFTTGSKPVDITVKCSVDTVALWREMGVSCENDKDAAETAVVSYAFTAYNKSGTNVPKAGFCWDYGDFDYEIIYTD